MKPRISVHNLKNCLLFSASYILTAGALAQPLDLATEPLFLQNSVQPNILFVTDDSGSMGWEILLNKGTGAPGDTRQSGGNNVSRVDFTPTSDIQAEDLCPGKNTMAYDPNRTYTPWKGIDEDGETYPEITSLTSTIAPYNNGPLIDPYEGHGDDDIDNITFTNWDELTDHMYFLWTDLDGDGEYDGANGFGQRECPVLPSYPAFSSTTGFADRLQMCRDTTGCVVVADLASETHGAPGNQQPAIQNYATWFTYYRRRAFVAQRAITELIDASEARIGLGTLHNHNSVGTAITDMSNSTNKNNLLQAVGDIGHSNGTPLRRALYRAGEYFRTGNGILFNPFSSASIGSPILSASNGGACQQNFTVLISDGFWNGVFTSLSNEDGDNDSDFDGEQTGNLYGDNQSDTLGDIAMHFYENDLSSLPNEVPESALVNNGILDNDMHQHMITYTVAFGVTGNIDCDPRDATCRSSFASPLCDPLTDATCSLWPSPITTNSEDTIDDMRHAAVNGRGDFLSANNPDELIMQLEAAISDIEARNSSSAAVAANSTTLNIGTVVYQAKFNTGDWHGDLVSVPLSFGPTDLRSACSGIAAGQPCSPPNWNAGELINARDFDSGRAVVSFSSGSAVPFRWPANYSSPVAGELNLGQVLALTADAPSGMEDQYGQNLVNYLRGDQSNELEPDGTSATPNAIFRRRANSVLGDIVNSTPRFVGAPNSGYTENAYETFASTYASRQEIVYVGANDGMLHAFDAETGEVEYSYIPGASYPYIRNLVYPNYQHRYFVDGSPTTADVYFGGSWHTALVTGLKAGGQSVFALDITDPSKFSENQSDIDDVFLWEFEHPELGYTYSQPDIVQLNDGSWVTIFGNGYNNTEADGSASTTGYASLFVVNIANGALIRNLSTSSGSLSTPNGLATVTPVDYDGNGTTDYVYGGDLEGNLWRFDLSSTISSAWTVSRVFTTRSPQGDPQPITSRPTVSFHPEDGRDGFLIYFGTGRYIDASDNNSSGLDTQSFYAVWDDLNSTLPLPTLSRSGSSYLQQSITLQDEFDIASTPSDPSDDITLRFTSNNTIDWDTQRGWFIDLVNPDGNNYGERQVTRSILRGDRIVFVTTIPDSVACNFGGTSFLMELSTLDGQPSVEPPLDINNDGVISAADVDPSQGVPSGIQFDGILTEPKIINSTNEDIEYKVSNSSSGTTTSIAERAPERADSLESRRTSWTELVTF